MIVRRSARPATLAVAVFSLAVAVLALPAPVRAADDQKDQDEAFDTKILRSMLEGLGLRKDGEAIVYQERAPLVIPPNTTLPTPEKADTAIANNPAWPKDPDLQRKKEEAKRARAERYKSADQKLRDEQRVLSPSELTPGATASNPVPRVGNDPNRAAGTWTDTGQGQRLTPSQLGYNGGLFGNLFGGKEDEVGRFTGEPPRAALTDPPPGYQTPSPDQPYGYKEKSGPPKATNYFLEHGTETDK